MPEPKIRVAINGLGRIGRLVLRHSLDALGTGTNKLNDPTLTNPVLSGMALNGVEIVAANDLVSADDLAYLIKYDSAHGRAGFSIEASSEALILDNQHIHLSAERDPQDLPWRELGVDVVLECTGRFTHRDAAAAHLKAGAKGVIISAPAPDADMTLVRGVNEQSFDPARHQIISNASCTTNSLAPPLKVLLDNFGIEMAAVTTIHAYTATQGLVDKPASKPIRGRAAAVNLIPTSTGSDIATVQVLPELKDRLRALAVRVPVVDGAITDISVLLKETVTVDQINATFAKASQSSDLKGILGYSEEDLVSTDIIDDPRSAILHAQSTRVVQGNLVKLQVWYDNEFGYSRRLLEAAASLPFKYT